MYPQNDWRSYLEHSSKGERWANHKYLYITPEGRYVYPEDRVGKRPRGHKVNYAYRDLTKEEYAELDYVRPGTKIQRIIKVTPRKGLPTSQVMKNYRNQHSDHGLKIRNKSEHKRKGQSSWLSRASRAAATMHRKLGNNAYKNTYDIEEATVSESRRR